MELGASRPSLAIHPALSFTLTALAAACGLYFLIIHV